MLSYKPGTGTQASHDLTHKTNVKSWSCEVERRMVVTEAEDSRGFHGRRGNVGELVLPIDR